MILESELCDTRYDTRVRPVLWISSLFLGLVFTSGMGIVLLLLLQYGNSNKWPYIVFYSIIMGIVLSSYSGHSNMVLSENIVFCCGTPHIG